MRPLPRKTLHLATQIPELILNSCQSQRTEERHAKQNGPEVDLESCLEVFGVLFAQTVTNPKTLQTPNTSQT